MLNHYPAWKNLLILLVASLGILYSVPNLYPDDEALQITHESSELVQADLDNITTALEAAQLQALAQELNDSGILLRFDTVEEQLIAKTAIEEALTDDYIVALNLAPTTPRLDAGHRRRQDESRDSTCKAACIS